MLLSGVKGFFLLACLNIPVILLDTVFIAELFLNSFLIHPMLTKTFSLLVV